MKILRRVRLHPKLFAYRQRLKSSYLFMKEDLKEEEKLFRIRFKIRFVKK